MPTRALFRERVTSKVGEFKASCSLMRSKPEAKLTPEERARAKAEDLPRWHNRNLERPRWHNRNLERPRWEVKFPECAGFETTDAGQFEAHMLAEHGRRPSAPKQVRLGKGLWNGPRLTEDGTPFEPTGLELGATVTWRELVPTGETYLDGDSGQLQERPVREWITRSGQVWCAGWRPRSAWVIPFDLLPGESAVMVEQRSSGELEHYSTCESGRAA